MSVGTPGTPRFTDAAGRMLMDASPLQDGSRKVEPAVDGGVMGTLLNNVLAGTTGPVNAGTYGLGNGAILDTTLTTKVFTMVLIEAGTVTTHASVKLEGSLDGQNWYQLIATTLGNGTTAVSTGTAYVQALFVRANVTIAQVGGTLTVQVAANN